MGKKLLSALLFKDNTCYCNLHAHVLEIFRGLSDCDWRANHSFQNDNAVNNIEGSTAVQLNIIEQLAHNHRVLFSKKPNAS